jgi:myo-inositol-1(or 4)-monophosphatase
MNTAQMRDRDLLAVVTSAAHEVGTSLLERPTSVPGATMDEFRTAFAAVDDPAVALVRNRLEPLLPGAEWAEELESSELTGAHHVWVVDAVDGAVQYLQGLPQWCVSIALVRAGSPVLAVLHNPLLDETYSAVTDGGAMRNGVAIRPSAKRDLAAALVATSQPPYVAEDPAAVDRAGRSLSAVLAVAGAVRNLGPTSWQIADVASGRVDAFWQYGVDDANLLGGALISSEAGARVTDVTGRPWAAGADSILVAPAALHAPLLEALPTR